MLTAEETGVDFTPRNKVVKVEEPSVRKAGVFVDSPSDLIDKLRNEASVIAVNNLPYNSDWYALNTGTVTSIGSSLVERSLASYMGRVNYSYNDRYLLTVTGRPARS